MIIYDRQLSLTDSTLETVVCLTRNSNPAPLISWYLGDTAITSGLQTNMTEGETDRWRSQSELSHKFSVGDLGSVLRCVVTHSGYTNTGAQHQVSVQLDINYKPIVTIARRDSADQLEDGVSSVQLTCNVKSSPASDVRLEAEFCSDPSPSRSSWSWLRSNNVSTDIWSFI